MDPAMLVAQLGGSCTWAELRKALSKRQIRRAVAGGMLARAGKGRYVLPNVTAARRTAVELHATASHTTAALHWGWGVKTEPDRVHLTFPRGRKLRGRATAAVRHWRALDDADVVDGWVTSPHRTVIDCCLDLPFAEALAVADSSWRNGLYPLEVARRAARLPPRLRRQVLAVLRHVDRGAANPFESVLRAHCLAAGADVVTQHEIKDKTFLPRSTSRSSSSGLSARPRASSTTVTGRRSSGTVAATPVWRRAAGQCSGSPGTRSCSSRTTSSTPSGRRSRRADRPPPAPPEPRDHARPGGSARLRGSPSARQRTRGWA